MPVKVPRGDNREAGPYREKPFTADVPAELVLFLIAIYLYQKILTPILQFRFSMYYYLPIISYSRRQNHSEMPLTADAL